MKVKQESEKAGLKLTVQKKKKKKNTVKKTKIKASSPITSCQIHGETVTDFVLGGFKITVDGDCSHEIQRHLLL